MNSKIFVEKHGKIFNYFEIDRAEKKSENCTCNENRPGANTECTPETSFLRSFLNLSIEVNLVLGNLIEYCIINKMIDSVKTKDDLRYLEELTELKSKVKQVRLEEKSRKRGVHYDIKKHFEPITKTVNETIEKLLEESKATTAAIDKVVKNFPGASNALANTGKRSVNH